ncbi:MAG: hypothetical protein ABFD66_08945 [Smithella sp.]|jgi:hypothetical protein|nr:hypothetical protein [Syntrophomonas sp.]
MKVKAKKRPLSVERKSEVVQDFVSGSIYQPFDDQFREYYRAVDFNPPPNGTLSMTGSDENQAGAYITARVVLANGREDDFSVEGRQGKSRSYEQGIVSVEFKGYSTDPSYVGSGYFSLTLFRQQN